MLSTKRLMALTLAIAFAGVAHAQPKPVAASRVQPASAHVPTADLDAGTSRSSSAAASAAVAASSATQSPAAPAPAPASVVPISKLSIDDIDQKIRAQVARQLSGDADAGKSIGLNTPAPVVPTAPPFRVLPPLQQPVHARSESVKFVGAFSDATGSSVLYEFRGAYYPAHVGEKLLNGWRVSKISGFLVTVTEGEGKKPRTWTEPIAGGAATADPQDNNAPARTLNDLSGALPPPLPAPLTSNGG